MAHQRPTGPLYTFDRFCKALLFKVLFLGKVGAAHKACCCCFLGWYFVIPINQGLDADSAGALLQGLAALIGLPGFYNAGNSGFEVLQVGIEDKDMKVGGGNSLVGIVKELLLQPALGGVVTPGVKRFVTEKPSKEGVGGVGMTVGEGWIDEVGGAINGFFTCKWLEVFLNGDNE